MIFEKIREKLQEYQQSHLIEHDSEECLHCSERQFCETDICDMANCNVCIWDKAINIINQVEAEYNNGWIPCSERLPENISTVLVQVKEIEKPTIGWYGNMDNKWILSERDFAVLQEFTVLAWQPLPDPYIPKAEPEWQDRMMNHFTKGE